MTCFTTRNPYNSKKMNHTYKKLRTLGLKFCSLREPCGILWLIYQHNLRLLSLSAFRWIICSKIQLALKIIWLFCDLFEELKRENEQLSCCNKSNCQSSLLLLKGIAEITDSASWILLKILFPFPNSKKSLPIIMVFHN